MKAVLISIQPKWCEKISDGKKTIEVRKTKPSIPTPFKVYVYQTRKPVLVGFSGTGRHISEYDKICFYHKGSGKVIGEFICDKIEKFSVGSLRSDDIENLACLSYREMIDYFYKPEELDGKTAKLGYAWYISQLKIYDKPKELSEFFAKCRISDKQCRLCNNCFEREDSYGRYYAVKRLTRPPQSWMYIEE